MIPYINSSGNVVIAAASPLLQASSGTFAVEGQTGVTIQAGTGQNGSIALAPKGTGTVTLASEAETGDLLDNQSGANFGNTGGKEANNMEYGSGARTVKVTGSYQYNTRPYSLGVRATPEDFVRPYLIFKDMGQPVYGDIASLNVRSKSKTEKREGDDRIVGKPKGGLDGEKDIIDKDKK